MSLVLIIILIGAGVALYALYASIVVKKNKVAEALAGVDVQLTQRHDLIPNVLAIAKRFMEHEQGLLQEITALRARAAAPATGQDATGLQAKFEAEGQLGAGLDRLFATAEAYPQLKSDGPMIEAQRSYQEVETNIAAARRFYNSAVGELRNAVQIFPGSVVAGMAGVGAPPPFFEAAAADRAPVDASAHL